MSRFLAVINYIVFCLNLLLEDYSLTFTQFLKLAVWPILDHKYGFDCHVLAPMADCVWQSRFWWWPLWPVTCRVCKG